MPHLQFEINKFVDSPEKREFAEEVRNGFARIMDTGTDHIAISIREHVKPNLSIGRAPDDDVCLMNLDIRSGRTYDQRRELALTYMELAERYFHIDRKHQYVTFTEHPGEDFHLVEKSLVTWGPGDDPL